jgi:hypothetical protein
MEYVEIIKNKWVKIKKNGFDGLKNHLVLLNLKSMSLFTPC